MLFFFTKHGKWRRLNFAGYRFNTEYCLTMATTITARTIIRLVDPFCPKLPRSVSTFSSIISTPSRFIIPSSSFPSFSLPAPSIVHCAVTFQFTLIRHHGSRVSEFWGAPQRVDDFRTLLRETRDALMGDLAPRGDKHHWLVGCLAVGFEFDTEQELFNFYIKKLAAVVGSEEEAKKKIYLVSYHEWCLGFGAEIDEDTKYKLEVLPGITNVLEDYYHNSRNKDPRVKSVVRFAPSNWDPRLDDILSYHFLSESNPKWNFDHWLVHVKQPDDGFHTEQETIDFCIRMLAEVVGSEDDAKEKIYVVWCKMPCGFGAEIDEETLNKLQGLADVITVLPDNAFDIKNKDRGVLLISSSSRSTNVSFFTVDLPKQLFDYSEDSDNFEDFEDFNGSEDSEDFNGSKDSEDFKYCEDFEAPEYNMEQLVEVEDSTNSPMKAVCKHWFITMEKPGGEFASMLQTIDCYIRTLAIIVGSEEEAKRKIYRIKCGDYFFGFGASIDEAASQNLKGLSGVLAVMPDYLFNKDQNDDLLFINALREMKVDLRKWDCRVSARTLGW